MTNRRDAILAADFSELPLWWNDAAPTEHAIDDALENVDVLVVGSGYAGLSCALELARGGSTVLVVEAERCGYGASTRNAGFLSGRAGVSKQINLEALVGKTHANRIFDEADAAFASLGELVETEAISCSLDKVGRFVGAHTPAAFESLRGKMREYNRDGGNSFRLVSRAEQRQYVDSDYWYGGMVIDNAGLIHPSRYHHGLKQRCLDAGVQIITGERVLSIDSDTSPRIVHTRTRRFRAREVVLATNGYTDSLSPWHQKRLVPISSTIVASEELGEERVRGILPAFSYVIDTKRVICFARPSPDRKRLLFGGRARFSPLDARQSAQILHGQLTEMFPGLRDIRVTHAWSGYMAFTFDFMPKIGVHDGVHYAIGCNGGCGIVMMSWLGKQVAQKILGTAERPSALEGLEFKTQPFYGGKPWFLPIVGNWWRFRDWLELRQAQRQTA